MSLYLHRLGSRLSHTRDAGAGAVRVPYPTETAAARRGFCAATASSTSPTRTRMRLSRPTTARWSRASATPAYAHRGARPETAFGLCLVLDELGRHVGDLDDEVPAAALEACRQLIH
jgi:hypothetical protein